VQGAWLGWPPHTEEALRHWTARNHRATLARYREALDIVATEFDDAMRQVLHERREQSESTRANNRLTASTDAPADVISQLILEHIDGVPLSDAEIISILRNWTIGELGTMSACTGIIVGHLAENPILQQELRESPEGSPDAIDEILRMHAPLVANRRVATHDVQLGSRTIAADDRVTVMWTSANRDENRFGTPDNHQPERNANVNLLHGRGIGVGVPPLVSHRWHNYSAWVDRDKCCINRRGHRVTR